MLDSIFADMVVISPFAALPLEGVFDLYHGVMVFTPIPGERNSKFSCKSTVYSAIFDSNKATETVLACRGCFVVT